MFISFISKLDLLLFNFFLLINKAYLQKQIEHKQFPKGWSFHHDIGYTLTFFATETDDDFSKEEKRAVKKILSEWFPEDTENVDTKVDKVFNEVLNPLFDSLIVDYPGFINVNENYFSDINLSSIDMHVFYKQQSHSLVVPLFPITTTRQELEYLN